MMVSFRHLLVPEYAELDKRRVQLILTKHLGDFDVFLSEIRASLRL